MKIFKLSLIFSIVLILMTFVLFAGAEAETPIYKWKMVSTESPEGFSTVFSEKYAKLVEARSNGRITIEVFPTDVLGSQKDVIELLQLGEVQLGAFGSGGLGGFVPQAQVFALQYLFPRQVTPKDMVPYIMHGKAARLLQEKFRNVDLHILAVFPSSWTHMSSNKPIHSPEDAKNIKHRVMANPILVASYNAYGFNTQTVDYSEVYVALQNKMIDSQVNPITAIYDMSFYEVQDYIFNMWNEMFVKIPVINKDLYDSLPEDLQHIVIESAQDLIGPMVDWETELTTEIIDKIKKAKPTINFYELTDEEVVPFKELAWAEGGPVESYLKIGGEDAKEIMDALLSDIEIGAESVLNQ